MLENLVNKTKLNFIKTTSRINESSLYQYGVDVLSGWVYYTPASAIQEFATGNDLDTIAKTRLIGMAVQTITMRPIGKLRNYFAEKWGVKRDSPVKEKLKVNLVAVTPVQSVIYGLMLFGGMAWSGNYDYDSALAAWGIGTALGAGHSIAYGFVQDKIRKSFNVNPAIKE